MIINNTTIKEAFRSFSTVFNKAFQEMENQYPRVAMEVPSETRDETYAWLGAVPSMREWIGEREAKNLSAYGYTMQMKADAYQFEIVRMKADSIVTEAMKEGKLMACQRDMAFAQALNDPDSFTLWLKTAPQVVPMGEFDFGPLPSSPRPRSRVHELMGLSAEDIKKYGNI